jgi:UDPglucose 6-dehydrogenase
MEIGIVGTGHVGLVTGACFADLGNRVICVDIDKQKIEGLKKGIMPIYEPGLEGLVRQNQKEKRLSFTTNLKEVVRKSKVIFIAVSTPAKKNGEADLNYLEGVSRQIARGMTGYKLIVEKSTVPVETRKWIKYILKINNHHKLKFDIACNPEFLREGRAIFDFMNPDRVVIGVQTEKARKILVELYKPLGAPVVVTDINSAELIKHASNSFLAAKISFINAVSNICEKVGADVVKIAEGMGLDRRIGRDFLDAGVGFGGFCFPKDLAAFNRMAEKLGIDFEFLKAVEKINQSQRILLVKKIKEAVGTLNNKTISILGLSFKPNTDDMRGAPSVEVIKALQKEGVKIRAFDPQAMAKASLIINDVKFCRDAYEAAEGADALLVITDWNEFKELDLSRIKKLIKKPIIIDGRNIYEPKKMKKMGFKYVGMGRK